MVRVQPRAAPPYAGPVDIAVKSKHSLLLVVAGYLYLLGSLFCNIMYLTILSDSVNNDFWWRQFNTTGGQTFLSDLIVSRLILGQSGAFSLFNESATVAKDYSQANVNVDLRPTAARRLMLAPFSLETAIKTIRKNSLYENIHTIIAYCWVDFGRQFELAHTAQRQHRCANNKVDNAAVYLDSLLRNIHPNELTETSFGVNIYKTVVQHVLLLPNGQHWLSELQNHTLLSVTDELAQWQRVGLQYYGIQYQNCFQYGLDERIVIRNAFGVERSITSTSVPYLDRGLTAWSTAPFNMGLWNDMAVCNRYDYSLVRSSNKSLEELGRTWDDAYDILSSKSSVFLLRYHLGPLTSIDSTYIPVPPTLTTSVIAFKKALSTALKADARVNELYKTMNDANIDVIPPSWRGSGILYHGGNPFCAQFGVPMPYPQAPFSFNDGCQAQDPFLINFGRESLLFAMNVVKFTSDMTQLACSCSEVSVRQCNAALLSAWTTLAAMDLPVNQFNFDMSAQEISNLHIQFIQMATNNSSQVLLSQPIIRDTSRAWPLFGWIALYDWVDGTREVLNFEGDAGNFTLMSDRTDYQQYSIQTSDLTRTASSNFWYVSQYITVMSCVLTTILVLCGAFKKLQIVGTNLFQYNLVFGSVWIGRPALCIRAFGSIVILCTSTATLSSTNQVTYFSNYQRPYLATLILIGEALWTVYVLNDTLLPLTRQYSTECARLSYIFSFIIVVSVVFISPFVVQTTVNRDCVITSFRRGLDCTIARVDIGSWSRVCQIIAIQIFSVVLSYLLVRVYRRGAKDIALRECHVLVPAAANSYFTFQDGSAWQLDAVACVMAGMFPTYTHIFDFKIWAFLERTSLATDFIDRIRVQRANSTVTSKPMFHSRHASYSVLGLMYMACSIAGSYAFLEFTNAATANDFWWASFDSSAQIHLCNWFNAYLQFGPSSPNIELADPAYGSALSTTSNSTADSLQISPLYAGTIQDEANSLINVITSLRLMDGCSIPWIMTPYCYVDFDRRWEMASTKSKQDRCGSSEIWNGAVYLESILRNTDAISLNKCWGSALEIGIFSHLRSTNGGMKWLSSTATHSSSISDEVSYWKAAGITKYSTQWQNYKSLGVLESFRVQNAFGWNYAMTLKMFNSSFQLSLQTSFKMHWPLAQDLTLVMSNWSLIQGKSLIRQSSAFAFANATPECVLIDAGILTIPLGPGFSLVRQILGPFGTISMRRIPVPSTLLKLYQSATQLFLTLLSSQAATQEDFSKIYSPFTMQPTMSSWSVASKRGGNILCDLETTETAVEDSPGISFGSTGACRNGLVEILSGDMSSLVKAALLIDAMNVTAASQLEKLSPSITATMLSQAKAFVVKNVPPMQQEQMRGLARAAKKHLLDVVNVSMVQFLAQGTNNSAYNLSVVNVFDPSEADFEVYAWLFLFQWVEGLREVVSFEGDADKLTAISTASSFVQVMANSMEIPTNLSFFRRVILQYVSGIMLLVACIVCGYILALQGRIEAKNMLSFSRVTALVWLGRPLIFARAFSAVSLLATSNLTLTRQGLLLLFESHPPPWYYTILTAGELNWMVYILNDVFSVVTRQYTSAYATTSFFTVWLVSAAWNLLAPPSRSVEIARVCTVEAVDFQLVCQSGLVAIGNFKRFRVLIGIVVISCALCYLVERICHPKLQPRATNVSFMVYAAASHQFTSNKWEYRGIRYVDKASAVLTGIISVEYRTTLVMFDIKTWRYHQLDKDEYGLMDPNTPPHLIHALPLIE
ncbi:hypothetical protein AC1031_016479 [Aphanomyces cochlioides]|nr:hypothetical protein AC1031_016479 [Aphanomyces cochlioides]